MTSNRLTSHSKMNIVLLVIAILAIVLAFLNPNDPSVFLTLLLCFFGALVVGWILSLIILFVQHNVLKKDFGIKFKSFYLMGLIITLFVFTFDRVDCSKHKAAYSDGYSMGETDKLSGHYTGGSIMLDKLGQNEIYARVSNKEDKNCFCIGYDNGYNGDNKKYKGE